MRFNRTVRLKDGRECTLRNGRPDDAAAVLELIRRTHEETDFLLSYPDEDDHTEEGERKFLASKEADEKEVYIVAEVDGTIAGSAGIDGRGDREKLRHRSEFGIGILKEYWGLGIGKALTRACIECAEKAGYGQLELAVVSENKAAMELYLKSGFVVYGRNPRGFRSRYTGWQELVLMCLPFDRA